MRCAAFGVAAEVALPTLGAAGAADGVAIGAAALKQQPQIQLIIHTN